MTRCESTISVPGEAKKPAAIGFAQARRPPWLAVEAAHRRSGRSSGQRRKLPFTLLMVETAAQTSEPSARKVDSTVSRIADSIWTIGARGEGATHALELLDQIQLWDLSCCTSSPSRSRRLVPKVDSIFGNTSDSSSCTCSSIADFSSPTTSPRCSGFVV
jgi:hypothetical protein